MYFTGFQGDEKLLYGTEHHRALTLIKNQSSSNYFRSKEIF